jgi:hypothetical protein
MHPIDRGALEPEDGLRQPNTYIKFFDGVVSGVGA